MPRPLLLWLDMHLLPVAARWIAVEFGVTCKSFEELGHLQTKDPDVYLAARAGSAVIVTKDADFTNLLRRLGPPPPVVRLTCGNCSNAVLRQLLSAPLAHAPDLVAAGEPFVEVGGVS